MTPEQRAADRDPNPKNMPPTCMNCGQLCNVMWWCSFGEERRYISRCCNAEMPPSYKPHDVESR